MGNAEEEKNDIKARIKPSEEKFSSYFVEPSFNENKNLVDITNPPAGYESVSIPKRINEETPNAEHFPPGMSVNGSSNLPIPEVHHYTQSKKKRKRKRKNKVAAENGTNNNKPTSEQESGDWLPCFVLIHLHQPRPRNQQVIMEKTFNHNDLDELFKSRLVPLKNE